MNELNELRQSVNETARVARASSLFLMVVAFFYSILIAKTNDLILLREENLELPLLGLGVPVIMFYVVAPGVFLLLNFNLFLRFLRLAEIARLIGDRLQFLLPGERRAQTALYFPFDYLQTIRHVREQRRYVVFAWLVVFVLVVLVPITLLLWIQLRFLAYQSQVITLVHQIVVTLQCMLLVMFTFLTLFILKRRPSPRRWQIGRHIFLSLPMLVVSIVSILALILSWCVLVVPDSWLENKVGWKSGIVWIFSDWWLDEERTNQHKLTVEDLEAMARGSMRRPELSEVPPAGFFRRYLHIEGQRISTPPPLLPPISPEDIELLCWLGIESVN